MNNKKLLILMYHRVYECNDPFIAGDITAETFDAHMNVLSRFFNVIPLSEGVAKLQHGKLRSNSVCITFDDGYKDNCEVAFPILAKYQLPATFFIATEFIGAGMMWNDEIIETVKCQANDEIDLTRIGLEKYDISSIEAKQRTIEKIITSLKYLPFDERVDRVREIKSVLQTDLKENLMMNVDQLKFLSENNMELGAHTVTHPILQKLNQEDAKEEIVESKKVLEKLVSKPVGLFAYPNGRFGQDFAEQHMKIVEDAGFSGAVSTDVGVSSSRDNCYRLKRFSPWDTSKLKLAIRLKMMFYRSI